MLLNASVVGYSGCVSVKLLSSVERMASKVQPENSSDVQNRSPIGRGRRASSRDMQSSMDSRLAKCELAVGEMRVEDTERGIEELFSMREELKIEMQGALNEAMDVLTQRNEALEA